MAAESQGGGGDDSINKSNNNNGDQIRRIRKSNNETSRRGGGGGGSRCSSSNEAAIDHDNHKYGSSLSSSSSSPCGACKFLRRKCMSGCIFAPYFGSDQGAARFAAVHKVFGASNVSKLLLHIPIHCRHDAVLTISYEAQARLSDPVYGCVSTILALQQQVASLQAELSLVQTQLINSRILFANGIESSVNPQQQQQHYLEQQQNINIGHMQPAYSNNVSCSSNDELIMNNSTTSNFNAVPLPRP